jgi:HD-like signal output (HDOD) protein
LTQLNHRSAADQVRQTLLKLEELPASARVVQAALRATADTRCTSERLQEVLAADPAATADVLRLANSAYYGVRSEIRTLALAVTLIGHRRLTGLLRHLLAGNLLQTLICTGELALQARSVALAAAVAAGEVARLNSTADPDEMMVAGLLHNVGEVVLLAEAGDDYESVLELAEEVGRPEAELRLLGIDSSEASAALLRAWDFPEVFVAAARHWDGSDWPAVGSDASLHVGFVHIGARLGRAWVSRLSESRAVGAISESAIVLTGVNPSTLTGIYRRIEEDIDRLDRSL